MEKTRKKFSTRKKIVLTVSIILVIVIVLAVVAVILLNSRIFQGEQGNLSSEINTSQEIKEDVVTFLVCGIDDDEGRGLGQRTDLIMYVVYDVKKTASIFFRFREILMLKIPLPIKLTPYSEEKKTVEFKGWL